MKKNFTTIYVIAAAFFLLIPVSVFAWGPFTPGAGGTLDSLGCSVERITSGGSPGSLYCLFVQFYQILQLAIPILSTLAVVGFFYGLVKYIFTAGNEDEREKAKQIITAGIVGLFLMAAIGGIINFLVRSTVGNNSLEGGIPVPRVDRGGTFPGGDF